MNLTKPAGHYFETKPVASPDLKANVTEAGVEPQRYLRQMVELARGYVQASARARNVLGVIVFASIFSLFVMWGATSLEIGTVESRLGMAAREQFGPVGQSFGGLDPAIYPGPVAVIKAWGLLEEDGPGQESVRWPAAVFAGIIGLTLCLQSEKNGDKLTALAVAFCWFSSVAVMHRSGEIGMDFYMGLWLLLALNQAVVNNGKLNLQAAIFTSAAFLSGGLPSVVIVVAASVVICRSSAGLSLTFLATILATIAGWSAWALSQISAEAWASAIALPVRFSSGSSFPVVVLTLCLPMVAFVPAFLSASMSASWTEERKAYVNGWWTVAAFCLFVGAILPQFARAALLPVVAGIAVLTGNLWGTFIQKPRIADAGGAGRVIVGASGLLIGVVTFVLVPLAVYVSMTIPYYRGVALVLVVVVASSALVYVMGLVRRSTRWVAAAMVLLCVSLKLLYTSIYVPEWNYRRGQGPWGRAIGQWVPADWPIYTLNGWPTDLAFATGHNFRQLTHPRFLPDPAKSFEGRPSFILLHPADFERWPKTAPPIMKVFEYHDQSGRRVTKVLARTGPEKPEWSKLLARRK